MSKEEERKAVAVVHCILNQATRWWFEGETSGLPSGMVKEVLDHVYSLGMGVLQLPCPEFRLYGNPRPRMTKDDYERAPGFRAHCRRVAREVCDELEDLARLEHKPRIRVLGIVGVEHSPSCAVEEAPRKTEKGIVYTKERGIFMEELEREMGKRRLAIPLVGINVHNPSERLPRITELCKG